MERSSRLVQSRLEGQPAVLDRFIGFGRLAESVAGCAPVGTEDTGIRPRFQ